MGITYEEETPAPKISYEERRAQPKPDEGVTLKKLAPFYLGPLGPVRAMRDSGEFLDKIAYEAGGMATDLATKAGLEPENAAKVGYVANVATQAIPTFGAGPLGASAAPLFEKGAQRLMQSALKPSRAAIDSGKAAKAINTLLDEGINATQGGAAVLRSNVNALQDEVTNVLAKYPNATVDQKKVIEAFQSVIDKTLKQGTPQDDIALIRKAMIDFANHPLLKDSSKIPVQLAQEMKQGIWRKLGEKSFGKGLVPDAARDAQKTLGTGLKEGIEAAVPEIAPLNAKSSEFLNALKLVEKRTGMEGNKNIIGLGTLSPSVESFLVWMLDRYPAGKSVLARMMHSGKEAIPASAARAVGAGLGAYSGTPPEQ